MLPESNYIPVATNDSLVLTPAFVAEEKGRGFQAFNDKPADVILILPSNVTADQIKKSLNSIPESKNVSIVVGSSLINLESMPAVELLQSARTDEALQLLPPTVT